MRTFVAVEMPPQVRAAVEEALAGLRTKLPEARWVPTKNLHITLRFLGEIEAACIPDLAEALSQAFGAHAPPTVQLGGAGTFPGARPARVAWIGLTEPTALDALARDVRAATDRFVSSRAERGTKAFSAHLTVARCRRPWKRRAAAEWIAALSGPIGPLFQIDEGVLMRSTLAPTGARYDAIRTFSMSED